MADPRRRTPRTDAVLDDPRLADGLHASRAGAASRRPSATVLEACRAGRVDPDDVVAGRARVAARGGHVAARASSTPPASWCTPTSVARRSPRRRSRRSPRRPAPRTSSSTSRPGRRGTRGRGGAGRAGRGGAGRRRRPRGQQRRRRARPRRPARWRGPRGRRGARRAGRDRRRLPDPRAAGVGRRAGCARWARRTGCGCRLPRRGRRPRPRSCSRCTRRTSGSRASPRRSPSASSPTLGVPVVADIGSGLLAPHPRLPDEPDAATHLRAGAALVTASGDKLLGGPQCGLLLGDADLVAAAAAAPVRPRAARRQAHPGRARGHPHRPGAAGRHRAGRPSRGPAAPGRGGSRRRSATASPQAVRVDRGRRRRRRTRRRAAERRRRPARRAGRRAPARATRRWSATSRTAGCCST